MSINSEITRITNAVASSYSAVNSKGGTIPQSQVIANLPNAIDSITVGSTASIKITGNVSSSDTVSLTKGSKTISGVWNSGTPRIPSAYQEVKYIEFFGSQYINLGFVPTNHFTEVKYYVSSYVNDSHLFGNDSSNASLYYHFTAYSNKYYWGRNGSEANGGSWTSGLHTVKFNYGSSYQVILDDNVLGSGTNITCQSGYNMLLGRRTSTTNFQGRYYYVQVTDKSTGNLVRNLVPCYRKSDSVSGMYDLVTGNFYTNNGSGTIGVGADVKYEHWLFSDIGTYGYWALTHNGTVHNVLIDGAETFTVEISRLPSAYQEVEYIQNSGSAYLNTGLKVNTNPNFDIDLTPIGSSNSSWRGFFGGRTSASNTNNITLWWESNTMNYYMSNSNPELIFKETIVSGQRARFRKTGDNYYVNEVLKTTASRTFTNGSNDIHIFHNNTSDGSYEYAPMRLHNFKFYNGTTKLCDYIPCYRKSDNVVGVYDLVSDSFKVNAGSGTFIVGGDI